MSDDEQLLQLGRDALARQAFSVLLGAQLRALQARSCELALPITDRLKQNNGFVHGGVISYLADNALTYAGFAALRVPVVTSEFKLNYVRPVFGDWFVARAAAAHSSRSQAVCRCDVFAVTGNEEKLCAIAQGTIVRLGEPAAATGP